MRIEIKTNGKKIKDPDIRALYLLDAALNLSTDKMLKTNLEWAISKSHSITMARRNEPLRKFIKEDSK